MQQESTRSFEQRSDTIWFISFKEHSGWWVGGNAETPLRRQWRWSIQGRDGGDLDRHGSAGNENNRKDSGYVLEAGLTAGKGVALGFLLHVILQGLIVGILEFSSALNLGFTECLKQKIS